MRQHRQRGHRTERRSAKQGGQEGQGARSAGGRGLRHHRVVLTTKESLAEGVESGGAEQHQRHQGVRRGVRTDVLEPVKNLHRGRARVVENQGHAEFGEARDENDGAAGKEARLDERQRHTVETTKPGAAEVLRGFLHRGVHVGEGGGTIEIHDRINGERGDGGDTPKRRDGEPVKGPAFGADADVDQESIERAVLSKNLFNADGTHEWRQDHRDEHHRGERHLARELEAVGDKGERQADREGDAGDGAGQHERVEKAPSIQRIRQDGGEGAQGEVAVRINEAAFKNLPDGPKEKHREEKRGESEDRTGKVLRHRGEPAKNLQPLATKKRWAADGRGKVRLRV